MQTIEIRYQGDLSEDVLRYVESTGAAKVLETCPLVISAREESDVLSGLLGAISHSPMKVDLVKVRRSNQSRLS
ncbi:MAG: hypothetical protein ACYC9Q_02395 [Bacillota bacterium]